MKRLIYLASWLLLAGWGCGQPVVAQATDSAAVIGAGAAADRPGDDLAAVPDSLAVVKGFGLATITEPGGKTHRVYVPVGQTGFAGQLPFYRRKTEVRATGQPWSISVDKVERMRLPGTYYEHLVIGGKRKHLLAGRVANGAVELFNYTETTSVLPVVVGLAGAVVEDAMRAKTGKTPLGIADRRWFVRRGGAKGELTQVRRDNFTVQMSEYFRDDPATAAAITNLALHYADMRAIVESYNRNRAAAADNK